MAREALTVDRIADAARVLLRAQGPAGVGVREVARALQVSAPALYKHVDGQDGIADALTAACLNEAADVVEAAARHREPVAALASASRAFRGWALDNRAEFALLFANPVSAAPLAGTDHTTRAAAIAGRRFGAAFLAVVVPVAAAGRLRLDTGRALPRRTIRPLRDYAAERGLPLTVEQTWAVVAAFHDLLGTIAVEAFGQLGFALVPPGPIVNAYAERRLDDLFARLVTPE